ncbi:hypothetical protein C6A85_99855 [Mycobacterium sp. ITM-2017-0098]|nr:hypothetical protein C6A85_99855 [Mycobacterium sp. ITM-2017-0098]
MIVTSRVLLKFFCGAAIALSSLFVGWSWVLACTPAGAMRFGVESGWSRPRALDICEEPRRTFQPY